MSAQVLVGIMEVRGERPPSGVAVLAGWGPCPKCPFLSQEWASLCRPLARTLGRLPNEAGFMLWWQAVRARKGQALLQNPPLQNVPNKKPMILGSYSCGGGRLSGLVVDVFGGRAVVSSSAAWAEAYRGHITACLCDLLQPQTPPSHPVLTPGEQPQTPAHGTPAAPQVPPGVPCAEGGRGRGEAEQRLVVWRPSLEMLKEEGWGVATQTPQKGDAHTLAGADTRAPTVEDTTSQSGEGTPTLSQADAPPTPGRYSDNTSSLEPDCDAVFADMVGGTEGAAEEDLPQIPPTESTAGISDPAFVEVRVSL